MFKYILLFLLIFPSYSYAQFETYRDLKIEQRTVQIESLYIKARNTALNLEQELERKKYQNKSLQQKISSLEKIISEQKTALKKAEQELKDCKEKNK